MDGLLEAVGGEREALLSALLLLLLDGVQMTWVDPMMSGYFSPASMRASVLFSSFIICSARRAEYSMSEGGMTRMPFSSARMASPGLTPTPPQLTGMQNSPPRPSVLTVTAEVPRDQTGTPYWRSSPRSVTRPSTMMPATPAARAA